MHKLFNILVTLLSVESWAPTNAEGNIHKDAGESKGYDGQGREAKSAGGVESHSNHQPEEDSA